ELSGPVGAAFAPTGRFLSGAVARMPLSDDSAPSPLYVAQRLLKRQKNVDFGDIGKTPPLAPTLQSSPPPVGDVY
ncbi:MAG TPA: hypothetical protein PKZ99_11085, partial [Azospirillaceae bacterium]|nr:hypothetical protein [Azospirillaceae bacterium]